MYPIGGQEPHLVAPWAPKGQTSRPFRQKGVPGDYSGFGANHHQNGGPDFVKCFSVFGAFGARG